MELFQILFLISKDKKQRGICQDLAACINNIALRILSPDWHIGMKPTWSLCIKEPIIIFSHVAKTFARSLISGLSREISLELEQHVSSECGLGISEIIAVKVSG